MRTRRRRKLRVTAGGIAVTLVAAGMAAHPAPALAAATTGPALSVTAWQSPERNTLSDRDPARHRAPRRAATPLSEPSAALRNVSSPTSFLPMTT